MANVDPAQSTRQSGETEHESGYIHGATFAHLSVAINSLSSAMCGYVDPGRLKEAMIILHDARDALEDPDPEEGVMEGRWTLYSPSMTSREVDGPLIDEPVPVVPCDDAAVERLAIWLYARSFIPRLDIETATAMWAEASEQNHEHLRDEARAAFAVAAGETL